MSIEQADILEKIDSKDLADIFQGQWQTSFSNWKKRLIQPHTPDPDRAEEVLEFCVAAFQQMYLCAFAVSTGTFRQKDLNKLAYRSAHSLTTECEVESDLLPDGKTPTEIKNNVIQHICKELGVSEKLFDEPLQQDKIKRFNPLKSGKTYNSKQRNHER